MKKSHPFFYQLCLLVSTILLLGFSAQSIAAPSLSDASFSVNENTANGTLIGQLSATGAANTSTLKLEVGSQSVSNWSTRGEAFEPVNFSNTFNAAPIVFSQVQSTGDYTVNYTKSTYGSGGPKPYSKNGYDILFRDRQQNTITSGFETILEADLEVNSTVDSIDSVNGSETVGWLAIENATQGFWSGLPFETALTDEVVTKSKTQVNFSGPFTDAPQLLATVATNNGTDQVGVGTGTVSETAAKVYMDEIDDGDHSAEAVSLLAMQGSGSLSDVNGTVIGEAGTLAFSDTSRSSASTVTLLNSYTNPVVFVQPLNKEISDTVFRFTAISANSFSGYLHYEYESTYTSYWDDFELQYFVFEAGSWDIGVQNYTYSITAGNNSGAFAINANTGKISVADVAQLDYESGMTQYALTVQVADGTGASSSANISIDINNVSDSLSTDAHSINGLAANDYSGWQLASAGDVNGDGLEDFIIGVPQDDSNGSNAGRAYVIFGAADGVPAGFTDIAAGTGGFVINGEAANDEAGFAVSGNRDVNGDGLDDLLIGTPFADPNGTDSGTAYVVFGKTDTSAVELSAIAQDSDNGGFAMNGAYTYDKSGGSVAMGDVNGDGLADLIIGEPAKQISTPGFSTTKINDSNIAYVVFGKTDGIAVELADIAEDSNNSGFAIVTSGRKNNQGWPWLKAIMSTGDVNSDGLTDFMLSSISDSINPLIFGKTSGSAINYSSISNDGNGFTINANVSGNSFGFDINSSLNLTYNFTPHFLTSPLGDINADGINDMALLATDIGCCAAWNEPRAYIIFGAIDNVDINLSEIEAGNGGFVIYNDASAISFSNTAQIYGAVSGTGDINGDGFDDLMIGDPYAAGGYGNNANGVVYIVYGKSDTSAVYLSDVVTSNGGFYTTGELGDELGYWLSRAGDTNGDGIDDMLFGSAYADPGSLSKAGSVYLMAGKGDNISHWGTDSNDVLTGTAIGDSIAAGQGNDTLTGNGGADVLYGGPGDDTIVISDTSFIRIDGGTGNDTLQLDGAGLLLDLASASARVRNVEMIDITGSGDNTLTFNKSVSGSTRIIVKGDVGDTVFSFNQQWVADNATSTLDGITYDLYSAGSAKLWLQSGLVISINTVPSINAQSFSVDEHTNGGIVIGTVVGDAGDVGDTLSFSILSGNDAGRFTLDPDTGALSIAESVSRLDYEDGENYSLTVQAADIFNETANAVITVNVNNIDTITLSQLDMQVSGSDQSMWGSNLLTDLFGSNAETSDSFSYELADIPAMPIDLSVMDLSMAGTFQADYSLELPVSRRDFVTLPGRPIPKSDSILSETLVCLPRHVRSRYGNCVLRCTTHSVSLLHHDLTLG